MFLTRNGKIIIAAILLIGVVIVSQIWLKPESPPALVDVEIIEPTELLKNDSEIITPEEENKEIAVDIKGEVKKPGVYKLKEGNRIEDAIEIAGGITENADINQINRAAKVYDEMIIYVPAKGEKSEESEKDEGKLSEALNGKISINQANEEQLTQLNGIGPSKAKAIIDYRNKNGYFKAIEEIMNVPGIGEKTFEQIKEQITVY